jgi:superfamily I DNA and/or RNA helicase
MRTSARSLILLGDPMQLAQITQGIHPDGSGASVLEHLLDGHITVPEDRGLFLEHTRRMHPTVCGFISKTFHEGRLESDTICSTRTTPFGTGLHYLPVEHTANRQSAPEEAGRGRAPCRGRCAYRLNVAISRALPRVPCASPQLLEVNCSSIEQMRLA